jgi:pSer/pThr/pTyr-binding forkhead associated (FHA) protein
MGAQIKLTVKDGIRPERQYTFSGRTLWTVGRAVDCQIHIPNDEVNGTVSRHHCQLEIDPPRVRVRDLGSTNGTYVNGHKLGGRRDANATPAPVGVLNLPEVALRPGDEIQLGNTILEVTSCTTDGA